MIADGQYRAHSWDGNTWKTLIGSQASLQANCNKERFNGLGGNSRYSIARIGILGNKEDECRSCDSSIGFGADDASDDSITCGNEVLNGFKRF